MAKSKSLIVLLALSFTFDQLALIDCQNCFIEGLEDGNNEIEAHEINELTAPDTVIWSAKTAQITASSSAASTHFPYLAGLRWTDKYEYKTTDIFSNFIATERSRVIERNVTFTCEDGGTRQVYFRFPIKDQNNSPPEFEGGPFEFDVKKEAGGDGNEFGDVNIKQKIIVRDLDWDLENANVKVMTTHNVFRVQIDRNTTVPIELGYEFMVTLQIQWKYANLGKYSFEILSDDGRSARSTPVSVYVLP